MDRTWHSNARRLTHRASEDVCETIPRSRALTASPGDACKNTPLVGTESGALTRVP